MSQQMKSLRLRPWTGQYLCSRCWNIQKRNVSQSWLRKIEQGKKQWAQKAREIKAGERTSTLDFLESRGLVKDFAAPSREDLNELLTTKRIGVYTGIDPTARSLHVGHMIPLMVLFWMHLLGFRTVSLIGGATAKVGDPSGRSTRREQITSTERKANIISIHYQLKRMWVNLEVIGKKHGYYWEKHWRREIANNSTWWNKIEFTEVLSLVGGGFRMGAMLGRETVKSRLKSTDGMSFSEFCYPVMQAWDWYYMYHTKDVQMQIGGSDQYGNIVSGIEAIRYAAKNHPDPAVRLADGVTDETMPVGLTVPLLTTSTGDKIGKSAGNAIWLDEQMTSLFDLYGYFIRTADADVERYLNFFTFLSPAKISELMSAHNKDPSRRLAQHLLAREFIELAHGPAAAKETQAQHRALFSKGGQTAYINSLLSTSQREESSIHDGSESGATSTLSRSMIQNGAVPIVEPAPDNPMQSSLNDSKRLQGAFVNPNVNKYAPQTSGTNMPQMHVILPKSLVYGQPAARVLYAAGLATSRSEGHRLVTNKGAYVGMRSDGKQSMTEELDFVPLKAADPNLTWSQVIRDNLDGTMDREGEEGILLLRVGKWKVRVVRIVSDEKFKELGLPDPPGWTELQSVVAAENAKTLSDDLDEQEKRIQMERGQTSFGLSDHDDPDMHLEDPGGRPKRREANEQYHASHRKGWNFVQDQQRNAMKSLNPDTGSRAPHRLSSDSNKRRSQGADEERARAAREALERKWDETARRTGMS